MLIQNQTYQENIDTILNSSLDFDTLNNSSLLIVGASGMIGSFLVDLLMMRNERYGANISVYAMGRNKERLQSRFELFEENQLLHLLEGDVTDPLPDKVKCDYLIHAASNTHPRSYAIDPIGTIMTNLMGTEQVLKHAVKTQAKRTLFLSTVEIYGENRGDVEKFDESYCGYLDCNTLRAGYTEGKRVSESLCQAYITKYGIDVVIPRLCRIFGPTMLLSDSKASSQFILDAVYDRDIVLKSSGNQLFSYCYVADAVSALLFILLNGENGEAYNISCDDFDIQLKDLAKNLAELSNRKVIFELPDETEAKGYSKASKALLDSEKLRKAGWTQLFSLQNALTDTVNILKSEIGNYV